MKKTLSLALATVVGLSFGVSNPASAEVKQPTSSNYEVKKLDDGRIKGIKSFDSAKIEQVLKQMGFTSSDLSKMSDALKKEIAQTGGKKVNLIPIDRNETKSKSQIRYSVNQPESVVENGLTFNLFAVYEGTDGSNNLYRIYSNGYWNQIPYLKTNDTIGIFWDSKVTPIKNANSARQTWFNPDDNEAYLTANESSPYGTQWKIPFKEGTSMFGAYTNQKVKVPTQYNGTDIEVGAGFMHPYSKQQENIPFKFGSGTVDFNNVKGYGYTLKYKINVGTK
ncbi:hypothetical protein V7183_24480 [Bacillus sp. JJ1127]|uniref:hypothetical protein n=1 Tax=Bacillus sp. JJ1127 TaxID=3122952 RepID=UPI002FFEB5D2